MGQILIVVKTDCLPGKDVAPDLKMGEEKELIAVQTCSCGSKHYDVGLKSDVNFIKCFECDEELDDGDVIHWCHPSRFKEKE